MREAIHDELETLAAERGRDHAVQVHRALRRGLRRLWTRVLRTYAAVIIVGVGLASVVVAAGGLAARGEPADGPGSSPVLREIVLEPATALMRPGDVRDFAAVASYSDGDVGMVPRPTWATSDRKVLRVDQEGVVQAVSPGQATLTAAARGKSGSARITVSTSRVSLQSLEILPDTLQMSQNETRSLTAWGTFSLGPRRPLRDVTWTSDSPSVVGVDKLGTVSAVGAGRAIVRATRGALSGSALVSVTGAEVRLERIEVSPAQLNLARGDSQQLTARGFYSDGRDRAIPNGLTWSSDNLKAVQVDQAGRATAVGTGFATVTAGWRGQSDTAVVRVTEVEPTIIRLQLDPPNFELCRSSSSQPLTATAVFGNGQRTPSLASEVTWESNNMAIASVDADGVVSLTRGATRGIAIIIATLEGPTGTVTGMATAGCNPVE